MKNWRGMDKKRWLYFWMNMIKIGECKRYCKLMIIEMLVVKKLVEMGKK